MGQILKARPVRVVLSSLVALAAVVGLSTSAYAQTNGLLGEYYNNPGTSAGSPPPPPGSPAGTTFVGQPVLTRMDATVNFGFATPPGAGINQDDFMVAWSGKLVVNTAGNHIFQTRSDDGVRLWINGALVIDKWVDQAPTDDTSAAVNLAAGNHTLRLEFYENGGGEECRLRWQPPGAGAQAIIPTGNLLPPDPPAAPVLNTPVVSIDPTTGAPSITITWAAVTGAADYELFRSVNGGAFGSITITAMTTYTDAGLSFNQDYCYRARSRSGGGLLVSGDSNTVCATPLPPPPRTNDHEEGLFDGKCACSSIGGLSAPWPLALLGLVFFLRRRRT